MKSLAEFYSLIHRFERESVSGSVVLTLCDPWTVAPGPSVHGVLQEEHWSGVPCSPPGALPRPGIKPRFPALQADSLLSGLLTLEAQIHRFAEATFWSTHKWGSSTVSFRLRRTSGLAGPPQAASLRSAGCSFCADSTAASLQPLTPLDDGS